MSSKGMDAITFLKQHYNLSEDQSWIEAGTSIELDIVRNLMEGYAEYKVNPSNPDLRKDVARQMYYSLCSELSEISKQHVGEKFDEIDEADRVQEIFKLTELLEEEFNLNL